MLQMNGSGTATVSVRVFLLAEDSDGIDDRLNDGSPATMPDYVFPVVDELVKNLKDLSIKASLFKIVVDRCTLSDLRTFENWGRDSCDVVGYEIREKLSQSDLSILLEPSNKYVWNYVVRGIEKCFNALKPDVADGKMRKLIRVHLQGYSDDCYSFPVKSCLPLFFLKRGASNNAPVIAEWILNHIILLPSVTPQLSIESFLIGVLVELEEQYREVRCRARVSEETDYWSEWMRKCCVVCNFCEAYIALREPVPDSDKLRFSPFKRYSRSDAKKGREVMSCMIVLLSRKRNIGFSPTEDDDEGNRSKYFNPPSLMQEVQKLCQIAEMPAFSADKCTKHLLRYKKFRETVDSCTIYNHLPQVTCT